MSLEAFQFLDIETFGNSIIKRFSERLSRTSSKFKRF